MAVFVDLEDDDVELPQPGHNGIKPVWNGMPPPEPPPAAAQKEERETVSPHQTRREEAAQEPAVHEDPTSMTVALGCYPIIMAVACHLDLNDLDSLSRVCRGVHNSLLQNRPPLLKSTLHCSNDDVPVDPESMLRYRARAGNWYYMEDTSRSGHYNGKAGSCARDMVAECRKCGTVVCRNCAIKPPAPAVLRDRHRRLCLPCQKSPISCLVQPAQSSDVPLASQVMQRAVCTCATNAGVWLCQPCGRGIRGADSEYRGIWRWRNQYGEVLGGLGTGIGDADRGVECARGKHCLSGKYIEHETDCDADDAREAEGLAAGQGSWQGSTTLSLYSGSHSWSSSHSSLHGGGGGGYGSSSSGSGAVAAAAASSMTPTGFLDGGGGGSRTPSPAVGPGYARHEVEGIGNKIKTVRVSMIRIGGCVPEWKDEKVTGQSLQREVSGEVRSWCGWCERPVPGRRDLEAGEGGAPSAASSPLTATSPM